MKPLIPLEQARIFFDGIFSDPRLDHPEGIAIGHDGAVWCGGQNGELYRIEPNGERIELIASTGGFILGLAFDAHDVLYACDLKHAAVFRLDSESGKLELFAHGNENYRMRIPNFPVVDARRNCLYVSDSYGFGIPGPGIWRFDLNSGRGELWYNQPLMFANGMALSPDRNSLYVVESFARRVIRIPILPDGTPGTPEIFVENLHRVPDGLAFDVKGNLYVSCYEPSRIYRVSPEGKIDLLLEDPDAHILCHPTNIAFRGTELFIANFGRWHITRVDVRVLGLPLV